MKGERQKDVCKKSGKHTIEPNELIRLMDATLLGRSQNMNKKELVSQLENAKNNWVLILASLSLFSNQKSYPILDESHCKFGKYTIEFKQVSKMMKEESSRNIACKEFVNMGLRALTKETFELVRNYCNLTNQKQLFENQNWYQFARMIRNCISHNFKFQFTKYDKSLLPISWLGKTIDISLDNSFLKVSFFGYVKAWELFLEMDSFVKNILN